MKVTPAKKKFGKHEVGAVFDLPDRPAKALIKLGRLTLAESGLGYQTRMMTAEPVASAQTHPYPVQHAEPEATTFGSDQSIEAPYGYKVDGTPRKRPGRSPAVGE